MKPYKSAVIRKPQDNKWYVEYSFRNPDTKKFERIKVYENINRLKGDEREAYADELRQAVDHFLKLGYNPFEEYEPMQVAVKNWTVIQGLNYFKQSLPDLGLRKRSIQTYESVLRMLYKELDPVKDQHIKDLTKQQISIALLSAKKRNSWCNTTFNNNLTFVIAILNKLIDVDAGILEINPAERIKPLPQTITKHRYFDDATFDKIKENASTELLAFIMFLYHTGTRPNEARQLTDQHILRDRKLLFIPASISKNKKDDYVPLSGYILSNYVTKGGLFKQSVNYYGRKFRELKNSLKLQKDFTLYSIKHTAAIAMAKKNVPPYEMMKFFRHSGLDITMAYLRQLGQEITWSAPEALAEK